jgi:hypothetical protein
MIPLEQFEQWAEPYALHQRLCREGCNPNLPKCTVGWRIVHKCVSLGPIAWFKKTHEDTCAVCRTGLLGDDGNRLWEQSVDRFIKYIYGL